MIKSFLPSSVASFVIQAACFFTCDSNVAMPRTICIDGIVVDSMGAQTFVVSATLMLVPGVFCDDAFDDNPPNQFFGASDFFGSTGVES